MRSNIRARYLLAASLALLPGFARGLDHPHLLFDQRDVGTLREKIRAGRPKAIWNRVMADCNAYRDPKSSLYLNLEKPDFGFAGTEATAALNAVETLSLAGIISGDRKLGRQGADILVRLLRPDRRERTYFEQRRKDASNWAPAFVTLGLFDYAVAYDWASPFLTEEEKRMIRPYLLDRVQLAWSHRENWPAAKHHLPLFYMVLPASLAMALEGEVDDPVVRRFPEYAIPLAEDYLDSIWSSDGWDMDGMNYGTALGHVTMNFAYMLERKGIPNGILQPRPLFKNAVLSYYLTREPGDRAFAISKTTNPREMYMPPHPMWLQIAHSFDSPMSRWWWRRRFDATRESPEMAGAGASSPAYSALLNLLLCNDADPDRSPEQSGISSSHLFKGRGVVVARRDHQDDTPVFRLVAGPVHSPSASWDAMSISLSAFGQRLVADPGYYSVKGKDQGGTTLLMRTESHTAPLLDGKGQEELSKGRRWTGLVAWHERQGEVEYAMAKAAGVVGYARLDGYGDCKVAERHAVIVHEATTPFYVVTMDLFEYPEAMAAREPALGFVLVASDDTTMKADDHGADIIGPKARLRAELVTSSGVTRTMDEMAERPEEQVGPVAMRNQRLIWSRKGRHGRMLTVLTPLKDGQKPPKVALLADTPEETSCSIRFGDNEDRVTFKPPRTRIPGAAEVRAGMRMKLVRSRQGAEQKVIRVPDGAYVVE